MNEETIPSDWVEKMRARQRAATARVLAEDCPGCTGPACDVAQRCRLAGEPECRIAADVLAYRARLAENQRVEQVTRRCLAAGCEKRHVAIVALARPEAPPYPPADWPAGPRMAMEAAHKFLSSGRLCLIIKGGTGAGKSTAAAWVVANVANEYTSAAWLAAATADNLVRWRATDPQQMAKLLVLDDLGTEYQSESGYASGLLGALLTDRINRELRTVVTTNLDWATISRAYGERLASRLQIDAAFVDVGDGDCRAIIAASKAAR